MGGHRISTVEAFLLANFKGWGLSGAYRSAGSRIQRGQGNVLCLLLVAWMPLLLS